MSQQPKLPRSYQGGCHCGAIRFEVRVENDTAVVCNCSICRKKGFIHLIVPPQNFTLLQGSQALTTYRFNTEVAQHTFCKICGIHPFYRPRSHPDAYDVNLNCLDQDVSDRFEMQQFDGRNWEANIQTLHQNSQ